ncbi:hypothetical protein HDU98_005338 [Podochytrium sp. JEL0797]|nr:hypothetical protein HDU98_005338 [Podochytrium sp. JEL0797]
MTPFEFIFLGTGPSTAIPDVACLTNPNPSCTVCLASMQPEDAASRDEKRCHPALPALQMYNKNRRGNTSGLYRYKSADGTIKNILIDCGKTFYQSAIQWFVHFNIRQLDAVLLTHDHADAIMGLDDLRSWTLWGAIQESIPIYLNESTFKVVSNVFPYIVNHKVASGGGHLASLDFRVFDIPQPWAKTREDGFIEFKVGEIDVVPFPVQHGMKGPAPYFCTAFQLPGLTYISDANLIPPASRELVRNDGNVLVLDTLRKIDFSSHMGYDTSIPETIYLNPKRVFYLGMNDELEHGEFEKVLAEHAGLKDAGIHAQAAFDGLVISLLD